ncbi:MAG: HD domain-containing protein [Lachnospiraceae bacterium]|nr:HD domain-containing protein [Lachnospiraceae bacterium]
MNMKITPSVRYLCESAGELLLQLLDYDKMTFYHSINTAICTYQICTSLDIAADISEEIILGALLHDVGKMDCPIEILQKNGSLTEEEYDIIKEHPLAGLKYVNRFSDTVKKCVEFHHERNNGTGYPHGFIQCKIPWQAQIVGIADSYAAMTEGRIYEKAVSKNTAILELQNEKYNSKYVEKLKNIALGNS